MSESKSILIAGAGIAGPALALLLVKQGFKCTIVGRAEDFRYSGQQIDVSGEGLKVIKCMGVEKGIRANIVEDDGIKFVTAKDEAVASFPVEKAELVKEIEIMRADLARIFCDRTKDDVEYIFGDYIAKVDQHESGVTVSLAKSGDQRDFDLVVAADGLRSKTRELVFGASNTEVVSMKQYAGYFSIPWQQQDNTWSRSTTRHTADASVSVRTIGVE